jgi:hypothetical protein
MQALGAYALPGLRKGLKNNLVHASAGNQNLQVAAERAAFLPWLPEISATCEKRIAG